MTPENMARHRDSDHLDYWSMLKTGYDHFEVTQTPPKVSVCEKKYVFDATTLVEGVPFRASAKCPEYQVHPSISSAVAAKQSKDDEKFQQLAARFDAREERQQRREERNKRIAEVFGNAGDETEITTATIPSADQPASEAVAAASAPADAQGETDAAAVETAFAPQEQSSGSAAGRFLKRWVPFGSKTTEAEASVGPITTDVVPGTKP